LRVLKAAPLAGCFAPQDGVHSPTAAAGDDTMQYLNSKAGYGWISITLHWLAVIGIIVMLVIGFRAEALGEAGDREGRAVAMSWHIAIGASIWLILFARVLSSWLQPKPTPVQQPRPLMLLASATHQLLLVAILIQIVSGPLAVWSGGRAINVFDAFSLPSPFAERNEGVHELAELLHAIGRWSIIVLATLHILAVVKHSVIDKDRVLQRMLAPPEGA
jgi:cytochrome b561